MVSNKTYNNVINFLLQLGEYHQQISTTSVGDIWEINLEKMEKMPLLEIVSLHTIFSYLFAT